MKMKKTITALLLVLTMIVPLLHVGASDVDAPALNPTEKYVKTLDLITSLGIYDFSDKPFNDVVTRGEFAEMICKLIGAENIELQGESMFSDVTDETPYCAQINFLAKQGLVAGTGNNMFSPAAPVTYTQALKIVLSLLGYDSYAQKKGGYPNGYISVAYDLNLTKNATVNYNENLNCETAVYLIKNAAITPVLDILAVQNNKVSYTNEENEMLISVYHDIYYGEGRITDNGLTALNSESKIGKEMVLISNHTMLDSSENAKNLIGQNVEYYYKKDGGVEKLIYVAAKENRNNVVTINAKDLATDDNKFTKTCVVKNVNNKRTTYSLYEHARLIYNGAFDPTFTSDTIKIDTGCLTLIDADSDDVYETVIAEEYVDIVMNSHSTEEETIFAKYSPDESFNSVSYKGFKSVIIEDAEGNTLSFSDLKQDMVLSVFRSKNNSCLRIVASDKQLQMNAENVWEDEHIYVADKENTVEMSYSYEAMKEANVSGFDLPVSGKNYTFLLNYEGYAVMIFKESDRSQYAYLLAMGHGSDINSNDVLLKLMLESGDSAIVKAAKKVAINGAKGKTPADVYSLPALYQNGEILMQLLKVTLNSKGEITSLETAVDNTASTYKFDLDNFSLDYAKTNRWGNVLSTTEGRCLNGSHFIGPETVIFVSKAKAPIAYTTEPQIVDGTLKTNNEEDIDVITYAEYIRNYVGYSHYAKLYDANEAWMCSAAIISEKATYSGAPFYVEKVSTVIDENGETKNKVSGWWSGDYWTFRESEEGMFAEAVKNYGEYTYGEKTEAGADNKRKDEAKKQAFASGDIKPGDVLRISVDMNQDLLAVRMVCSPTRQTEFDDFQIDFYAGSEIGIADQWALYGIPCILSGNRLGISSIKRNTDTTGAADTYWVNNITNSAMILVFDAETKEVNRINSISEIPVASTIGADGKSLTETDTGMRVYAFKSQATVTSLLVITNVD